MLLVSNLAGFILDLIDQSRMRKLGLEAAATGVRPYIVEEGGSYGKHLKNIGMILESPLVEIEGTK